MVRDNGIGRAYLLTSGELVCHLSGKEPLLRMTDEVPIVGVALKDTPELPRDG